MADESFARSTAAPVPTAPALADGDYDALCAAIMATARGRWFMEEYARRNRHAETERLLAAIARLEAVVRTNQSDSGARMRDGLLDMAKTIAQARAEAAAVAPEAAASGAQGPQASVTEEGLDADVLAAVERLQEVAWTLREYGLDMATCDRIEALTKTLAAASALRDASGERARRLGEVLHQLDRRITAMLESGGAGLLATGITGHPDGTDRADSGAPATSGNAGTSGDPMNPEETTPESAPADLQRDLDLPQVEPDAGDFLLGPPATGGAAGLASVIEAEAPSSPNAAIAATTMPAEQESEAAAQPSACAVIAVAPSGARMIPWLVAPPDDPLAALNAMSEEERIALFT